MKTIQHFAAYKQSGRNIAMLTCYDYASAKILNESEVDCLLVGDSVAMTLHGFESTLHATPEMMALHTAAVRRGAPDRFIIADMPFLSYRKSLADTMETVSLLMRAGANAVKLEGVDGHLEWIKHIVQSGVPVCGHLGLLPQSVHATGGYHVQNKEAAAAKQLLQQAKQLEAAGAFAVVLECIPAMLAGQVSQALTIPTIGIGAGADTDGQVLVLHDMLGYTPEFTPKFLRRYAQMKGTVLDAVNEYVKDVQNGAYPAAGESYV